MATTILTNNRTTQPAGARIEGGALLVPLSELESATGWDLKPEGACLGDRCVPLPAGRESEFVREGGFDITALAGYLEQPVVHDAPSETWVIGEAAGDQYAALESLVAPDFTLPDLDGRMHSLSDYRGRKVFLASWASW